MSAVNTSLVLAGLLSMSAAHAADNMSRDEYSARKDLIEAQYRVDRTDCERLAGNAEDVCIEQAKGRLKIERAELDTLRAGQRRADQRKLAETRAEATYAVATERCDDFTGHARDACMRDARDAKSQARTPIPANRDGAEAFADAGAHARPASYEAALASCNALAGASQADCVNAARALYDKN